MLHTSRFLHNFVVKNNQNVQTYLSNHIVGGKIDIVKLMDPQSRFFSSTSNFLPNLVSSLIKTPKNAICINLYDISNAQRSSIVKSSVNRFSKSSNSILNSSLHASRQTPINRMKFTSKMYYNHIHTRGYNNWTFRNEWMSQKPLKIFTLDKPLYSVVAANVLIYFIWNTYGKTHEGSKKMAENWTVSISSYESHPWSLLTSSFSHTGLLHLIFNMIAMVSIGRDLQTVMGWKRMLLFLPFSALCSSVAHLMWSKSRFPENWQPVSESVKLIPVLPDGTPLTNSQLELYTRLHGNPPAFTQSKDGPLVYPPRDASDYVFAPALGASGIVSGLFGISAVLWPRRSFNVFFVNAHSSTILSFFIVFSAINILINPNSHIGHAAHMGGLASGIFAAAIMRSRFTRIPKVI